MKEVVVLWKLVHNRTSPLVGGKYKISFNRNEIEAPSNTIGISCYVNKPKDVPLFEGDELLEVYIEKKDIIPEIHFISDDLTEMGLDRFYMKRSILDIRVISKNTIFVRRLTIA